MSEKTGKTKTTKLYKPKIKPFKIGVMIDTPNRPVLPTALVEGLEIAFDEALETGLIERPVELVKRSYDGQPEGAFEEGKEAYRQLVEDEHVLGIAGPIATDNCLTVLPLVHKYDVPAVSTCGTQLWVGRNAFSLSGGGMGDEPAVMAEWFRKEGLKRIAVLKDAPSQTGEEYAEYFRYAAQVNGLSIILEQGITQIAPHEEVVEAAKVLKSVNPDAVVYLGLGNQITRRLNPAFEELDWFPPRITTTAFVYASVLEEWATALEGWHGIDQYHEGNEICQGLFAAYEKKYERKPPSGCVLSYGYDIGRVLALGLSRMRLATPSALRDALETIRRLPASNGAPGTIITFGPEDHRGYKGSDFILIRKATDGKTVLVSPRP